MMCTQQSVSPQTELSTRANNYEYSINQHFNHNIGWETIELVHLS